MKKIIKKQRKTNPIAKQLSNPMWKQRIVRNKIMYTRKLKYKEEESNENK
jgi:stalled ribosome alternative rescue factor ArfA